MKPKPQGSKKYRNLTSYRDRIFYDRTVTGRRFWRELKVTDWIDAVIVRDRLEELEGIEKVRGDVPRFDDFAKRYLREDTANLAATFLRSSPRPPRAGRTPVEAPGRQAPR